MADQLRGRTVSTPPVRPRPMWQTALMWFAGGLAVATAAGFFLDAQRGAARRRMVVDRGLATGRDMTDWSGKKARHMRNKAMGTVAELRGSGAGDTAAGGGRY